MSTDEKKEKDGCCSPHPKWFCTFEGIFKLIEFITVLCAWLICIGVYQNVKDAHVTRRYLYFLIIAILCWIFTIIIILLYFCGCFYKRVDGKLNKMYGWYIFLLTYSLVWFFFWFAGSVLIAWHYRFWVGNAAAAFFGFVNTVLFFIDAVTYYRLCRKYRVQIRAINRGLLENEANNGNA